MTAQHARAPLTQALFYFKLEAKERPVAHSLSFAIHLCPRACSRARQGGGQGPAGASEAMTRATPARTRRRPKSAAFTAAAEQLPTGSGTPVLRLWVRLLACAKVGEKHLRRRFEEEFQTTLPRFDVMAALFRAPEGLPMSTLSRNLLVSNGNATVVVRQLQDGGFATTRPNPRDARSVLVALTAEGKTRFLQLAEAHHRWIAELLAKVPPDQVEDLGQLLGNLRNTLAERS